METTLLAVLLLGFVIGFRHAFEPDHVIAVSTLLHRERKLWRAIQAGLIWGLGHTTTLFLGVMVISLLRLQLNEAQLAYLELPVAVMLILLGGLALIDAFRRAASLKRHQHDGLEHYHTARSTHPHSLLPPRLGWQAYVVGLVHGLAGSGALLLLTAATLPSTATALLYALIFGFGSVAGMGLVTLALAIPFLASRPKPVFHRLLTGTAGVLSVGLGVLILLEVAG